MTSETKEKQSRDCWSEDEQIFFVGGYDYGLTEDLRTICLGQEEDINKYFETGEMTKELNPLQKQVLAGIAEYRKELVDEQPKSDIKRRNPIRSRPAGTIKCRTANIKPASLTKRIALRKIK